MAATRLAAHCLIRRYFPKLTDDAGLLKALETTDPRLARRIREWRNLPGRAAPAPEPNTSFAHLERVLPFPGGARPLWLKRDCLLPKMLLAFARHDLGQCVGELRNQGEPGRANLLYKKSIRMGAKVARGEIDADEVENALYQACVSNGLVKKNGQADVHRQIKLGFKTAAQNLQEGVAQKAPSDSPKHKLMAAATPFVAIDPAQIPPRQWIYGRHYIRKYVSATVASGGLGKSATKIAEAISMAIGRDLLSNEPIKRQRVWYWNGEDPLDEISRRIAAICQYYNIDSQELEGWFFIDTGHDMPICLARENRGKAEFDEDVTKHLLATIVNRKIDVVILDPFIAIHLVGENNNPLIDQIVKRLGKIANEANCAIEIVHHIRKPSAGQHEITVDDARGGSAIVNAVRSCKVLNRMGNDEAQKGRIDAEDRFRYFRVDSGKQNLAPPQKATWRCLESVQLPNGDNVQVVTAWKFPEPVELANPEDIEFIRSLAETGRYRWDIRATMWIGCLLAERLKKDLKNKADKEDIRAVLK
jgi:hypothetical protein